ncbi:MAG: alpha/beta hydrolase [Alphaproteobacteria bacterium]|nr:alpha/beta hydrolase [Alphaproteobacteria bacterium]
MNVTPQTRVLLDRMTALKVASVANLSVPQARDQMEAMVKARNIPPTPIGRLEERQMPGPGGAMKLRIYWPAGAAKQSPAMVYFHGGGHVIGSLDTHDSVARNLCVGANIVVVSVDYRLAPEHPFPAAADDCYAATVWTAEHASEIGVDPSRLAVGGDSAGGNLAAVVALMARDAGRPKLRLQLLVYPIADYACVSPTYKTFGYGYGVLDTPAMLWFQRHYLKDLRNAQDWRASPIKAASHRGLAPGCIIAAQCDVLHDDAPAYAEALRRAEVPVEFHEYAGVIHGFFSMAPIIDEAVTAQAVASAALKHALA